MVIGNIILSVNTCVNVLEYLNEGPWRDHEVAESGKMSRFTVNYVNNSKGEVVFNGIPYGDIDRTGHWAVWKLSMMLQAARAALIREGDMFSLMKFNEDGILTFIVKQSIRLKSDLHRLNPRAKYLPIKFGASLTNVGNSSFSFTQTVTDGSTNNYLGKSVITMVAVDVVTRRSCALPVWFKEKYKDYISKEKKIRDFFPDMPVGAFKQMLTTRYSDIDRNKHVNQSCYFEYCMNCATLAALGGHYKHFTSDLSLYPVLEIDLFYINECAANEDLDLYTWQDQEKDDQIYFTLMKADTKVLNARFRFDKFKARDFQEVRLNIKSKY